MASSSNNNQGNNSSDESNEIFQSSEVPQSAQNFDDDLVPIDIVDGLYFTASEEFITRSLSGRQHTISHEQATHMFVMIISHYLNEYFKESKPDHVEEMKKDIEK